MILRNFLLHLRMQMPQLILLILTVAAPLGVRSGEMDAIGAGAAADLQKSLAELSTVRQEIEVARLPLARQVTDLEQRLTDRRAELARAQRLQENQLVELNAMKAEAKRQAEELKYIDSLVSEYARAFRSRLNFVEEPRYKEMFESVDKAAVAPDLSPVERFSQRTVLLTTALKRSEGALGGELIPGKALDSKGRGRDGKVALFGPVAIFASSSGDIAGLLQQELNKPEPTVVQNEVKVAEASRALVRAGSGELVLDPTLGNAFKLAALKEGLIERLAKGGLIMVPLLGLGVAALVVALLKWVQLLRIRVATEADLQAVLRLLESREREKALSHVRRIPGPAGNLLAAAIEHADEKKEYIEEVLYEKILGARAKLERGLAFLALSATTGPLMGLLGTVMGMIATFKMISSFGSGDPKQLAAGISEALICTATGMSVAIPSLLFHAFLSRKAKGIIGSMEQTAVGFINGVPAPEEKPAFAFTDR
jgi:biopolymer transport protein ExbB